MAIGKHCRTSVPCCHSSPLGKSRSRLKQAVLLARPARSHAQGNTLHQCRSWRKLKMFAEVRALHWPELVQLEAPRCPDVSQLCMHVMVRPSPDLPYHDAAES